MNEYALVHGQDIGRVIRKDHFGNHTLWMLDMAFDQAHHHLRWVPAKHCVSLDPALNILFERKENGETSSDS
jgi:hypothetical protein